MARKTLAALAIDGLIETPADRQRSAANRSKAVGEFNQRERMRGAWRRASDANFGLEAKDQAAQLATLLIAAVRATEDAGLCDRLDALLRIVAVKKDRGWKAAACLVRLTDNKAQLAANVRRLIDSPEDLSAVQQVLAQIGGELLRHGKPFTKPKPQVDPNEPLTDSQDLVDAYIRGHGPVSEQEISIGLRPQVLGEGTIRRHIVPALKKKRGLKHKRGAGYYYPGPVNVTLR